MFLMTLVAKAFRAPEIAKERTTWRRVYLLCPRCHQCWDEAMERAADRTPESRFTIGPCPTCLKQRIQ